MFYNINVYQLVDLADFSCPVDNMLIWHMSDQDGGGQRALDRLAAKL